MSGHTYDVTRTSTAPATPASRTASSSMVSAERRKSALGDRQIGLWINGPAAALELMLLPTASRSTQGELHPRLAGTVSVRWEEPLLPFPLSIRDYRPAVRRARGRASWPHGGR